MLMAFNSSSKKRELSYDLSKETNPKKDNFFCPVCNNLVIFVDATFKIKHFRHKVESNCDPEPETNSHILMKLYMRESLNLSNENIEVNLGFARPDLYIPKEKIAIEVQQSKISYDKFIERSKNYAKNEIYVLWIFHENLLKSENISETLKKAHQIYFGKIYVFRESYIQEEGIYPVHFSSKSRIKETFLGEEYKKYYKKKRNLVLGDKINNFSLTKKDNSWDKTQPTYKIATFNDERFWSYDKS